MKKIQNIIISIVLIAFGLRFRNQVVEGKILQFIWQYFANFMLIAGVTNLGRMALKDNSSFDLKTVILIALVVLMFTIQNTLNFTSIPLLLGYIFLCTLVLIVIGTLIFKRK